MRLRRITQWVMMGLLAACARSPLMPAAGPSGIVPPNAYLTRGTFVGIKGEVLAIRCGGANLISGSPCRIEGKDATLIVTDALQNNTEYETDRQGSFAIPLAAGEYQVTVKESQTCASQWRQCPGPQTIRVTANGVNYLKFSFLEFTP
jgi:hypothetical protein